MANPLLQKDKRVPDYQTVKPEHFEPAFDAIINDIRKQAAAIKADEDAPGFANTAEPLESLFFELTRVYEIYGAFANNDSSKAIDALSVPLSLKASAIGKEIFQDQELAAHFKAVHDMRDQLALDEEQQRVLENLYNEFEDNGTFLDDADKQELNRIDNELIGHCNTFEQNNASGANQQAFLASEQELAGVPDDIRESMQENVAKAVAGLKPGAKDADKEYVAELDPSVVATIKQHEANGTLDRLYLFRPERLLVDDLLSQAADRSFRQNIFEALNRIGTVAPYDNEQAVQSIQRLRHERTELLNKARAPSDQYAHYADSALRKTMAGSLDSVEKLFGQMEAPLLAQFEKDIATLEQFAAGKGFTDKLEPWDVPYWAAQYKQETWQFDGGKLSEYFEVNNVIEGFLNHSAKLFELEFKENTSYSKIHDDVKTFDVTDRKTGEYVGILHMDLFARPGKRGGAWATTLQQQHSNEHGDKPVIALMNCNLPKPGAGKPALVGAGQVETFFHEGGHALNQLLGTRSRYATLHGTAHPSDFVENHSMVQERWAFARNVLDTYARHYKTGEKLPEALIKAQEQSAAFLQSREPLLLIQNSKRDFLFHSMKPAQYKNIADTHEKAALNSNAAPLLRPYPLSRFGHLFDSPASSYAAGYYSYLWAESCAADIFAKFEKNGLYDRALANALKEFYRDGACRKAGQTFRNFAGRDPSSAALLGQLGIAAGNSTPDKKGPRPPEPGMPS